MFRTALYDCLFGCSCCLYFDCFYLYLLLSGIGKCLALTMITEYYLFFLYLYSVLFRSKGSAEKC